MTCERLIIILRLFYTL